MEDDKKQNQTWELPASADPSNVASALGSWTDLASFLLYCGLSTVLIRHSLISYFRTHALGRTASWDDLQQYFKARPQISIAAAMIWYVGILAFLYATISLWKRKPFWRSLDWKNLSPAGGIWASPWFYLVCGGGLAFLGAMVSRWIPTHGEMPSQLAFNNPTSAILQVMMALLFAPALEETVFRGYFYSFFVRSVGAWGSIILTSVVFGMVHGGLLAWNWGLMTLLAVVGVVFGIARWLTGTVLSSFLLHLGYNFTLVFADVLRVWPSLRGYS